MNKEKLKDYLNGVTYAYPELEQENDERPTVEYKRGFNEALELAMAKIDQLEEPEVLSQEWIDEHAHGSCGDYVLVEDLQKLLMPKQEEPEKVVVPQFVGEWYETNSKRGQLENNIKVLIKGELYDNDNKDCHNFYKWFLESNNPIQTLINMKNGYVVEEKKYYVIEPTTGQFLIKDNQKSRGVKWVDGFSSNPESYTEQEIKNINERYWEFRKPIEEVK